MTDTYDIGGPIKITTDAPSHLHIEDTTSASGTVWDVATNVEDNLVIGTNLQPDVLILDPNSNEVNMQKLSLRSGAQKVRLMADPTSATYDFQFPSDGPGVGQTIVYDGSKFDFHAVVDNPSNVVMVRKDPQIGQFSSILSALASIPSVGPNAPTDTNRYVIKVLRGDYEESATLNVPSYVFIVGQTAEACRISPSTAGYDLFVLKNYTGLMFLTIRDVATPNNGIIFDDVSHYSIVHKIEIANCSRAVLSRSVTTNCYCRLEYTSVANATEYGVLAIDNGVDKCIVNIENFSVDGHSDAAVRVDGALSQIIIHAAVMNGDGIGTCCDVIKGSIDILSFHINNWTTGVHTTNNVDPHHVDATGILFENCVNNLLIEAPNTTGHIDGFTEYLKTNIEPNADFFVANQNKNIITVSHKGSNFASVKAAVDSITTASPTNLFVVFVGPGIYNEDPFTIPSHVVVKGFFQNNTVFVANDPSVPFITMDYFSILDSIKLTTNEAFPTVPTAGGVLVDVPGDVLGRPIRCQNVTFEHCETLVRIRSTMGPAQGMITNCHIESLANFVTGFLVADNPVTHDWVLLFMDGLVFGPAMQQYISRIIDISSSAPVPNVVQCVLSDFFVAKIPPYITGEVLHIDGGVQTLCDASVLGGFDVGVKIPANTVESIVQIYSTALRNTQDINIQNINASGTIQVSATRQLIDIAAPAISAVINGTQGDVTMTGTLYQGANIAQATDISTQIQQGSSIGTIVDVTLSNPANLDISVTAGSGYLMVGISPNDYLQHITWSAQTISIPANLLSWLFITNTGTFTSSTSEPSFITNIIIGAAKANNVSITYIQNAPRRMNHLGTNSNNVLRSAIGSIFVSGCLATPSVTAMQVDVSSGNYWYGTDEYTPSAVGDIAMIGYHRNGIGGWTETTSFTAVPVLYDDNTGTPVAIPVSNWVKHALYIVGDGSEQTYLFVYGQELFLTEAAAQTGGIPTSPPSFVKNVAAISAIIVTNGDTTLPSSRFRDIRPIPSFRFEGATASADHNSLLNLTVGDAHPQYFRTDGTRVMAGNINAGGNNVVNVNLVDGVDVSAHASRHLPGGADPLATATPVTISTVNAEGVAISFARSDHLHSHGNQPGGALHASATPVASGFMSSADKTRLDAATDQSTSNTLASRDAGGNSSFVQIHYDNAGKTQAVSMQAPAALASSYTLTLPPDMGTNNYVLTTDGAGVTSWQQQSSGFSDPMTTAGDMIYRNISNVTSRLPRGSPGDFLQINTTNNVAWQRSYASSKSIVSLFDDFRGGQIPYGDTNWGYIINGAGANISIATVSGNWLGAITLFRGTNGGTSYSIIKKANSVRLGAGSLISEFAVNIGNNLPSTGQNYTLRVGFCDQGTTNLAPTNGCWFELNNENQPNFVLYSSAGATTTTVVTATSATENTWFTFRIDVTTGSVITYYINDVSVGNISTNVPASSQPIAPFGQIVNVGGVQNREFSIDYFSYTHVLTGARY
jgi:pectin methylesterase-like acyl-CoA thioesterase